jgi:hypothetical protein
MFKQNDFHLAFAKSPVEAKGSPGIEDEEAESAKLRAKFHNPPGSAWICLKEPAKKKTASKNSRFAL